MGKKRKVDTDSSSLLSEGTKHSIVAIACFAFVLFFILARFARAGLVGNAAYTTLTKLFGAGIGFYLIPLTLLLLGISFLHSIRPNFVARRLVSGLVIFLTLLGIFNAGVVGSFISRPLVSVFGFYSLIFLIAVMVVALLVMFDTRLPTASSLLALAFWRKKQDGEEGKESGVVEQVKPSATLSSKEEAMVSATLPSDKTGANDKNKTRRPVAPASDANGDDEFGLASIRARTADKSWGEFAPPPLSLLEADSGKPAAGDIKANANIIKRTLANFAIDVEMDEVSIGPSITRYALKPAEGVKLSRIVGLQNDLSLALAAHPLRIEAPIPGKSLVGIEIPNRTKSVVGLGSLLGSAEFASSPLPLLVSLGRDITGRAHFANVAKAPHLLIAGTTGSGKSVVIHTLITSLLYRNPPDRLRFIMIDPKRVELTLYNKIPHLLTPVVTEAKKAILALKWAIKEMERRYNVLESATVRDIKSYHEQDKAGGEEREKMPYIVIIIDELADIMSAYPRELESSIVRLAQMSRAVGIHLVLSTQRPSVEVITGLIKANIPARVALQVASQIDSRTILDMAGAEKLLGSGDMLYLLGDMSKPVRLQSAFISEGEVKKVSAYVAKQYENNEQPDGGEGIALTELEKTNAVDLSDDSLADGDDDDLYEDARDSVIKAGKASASYLQRKLKIGYARAARLLDMLEERGVIGPGDGAKTREVYESYPTEEETIA